MVHRHKRHTFVMGNVNCISFVLDYVCFIILETGDHYLYICNVEQVYGNEQENAVFAWNGYSEISPAKKA